MLKEKIGTMKETQKEGSKKNPLARRVEGGRRRKNKRATRNLGDPSPAEKGAGGTPRNAPLSNPRKILQKGGGSIPKIKRKARDARGVCLSPEKQSGQNS